MNQTIRKTYKVSFSHTASSTDVMFDNIKASNEKEAQLNARRYLAYPNDWTILSVEEIK